MLLKQITGFYDFEAELKNSKCTLNNDAIGKILQYLLDGRQFHDDTMEKIVENKEFMEELITAAKKKRIIDEKCCYENVYEILANEYFDLMVEKGFIDKKSLSKAKLMRYFEIDDHKSEIIELDAKLVAELGLISKLNEDDINEFLCDENSKKQKKMIEILKLVIGRIDKTKLNGLALEYFDDELLQTVVLSRYNDLSNDKIGEINFSKLTLKGQKVLLKKMADNDFKVFSFESHWQQDIDKEAWESLNITDWRKFVYKRILESYETISPDLAKNSKILQLMPINILSLLDTKECKNANEVNAFDKFFDDFFDSWSTGQILAFGNCSKNKLDKLKGRLKTEKKISLSENAVETFLSLQQIFQKFVKSKDLDNNNLSVEKMLFDFFEVKLLDEKNLNNLIECLKYIFGDVENNYFAAMIIMEEFILLDENTVKPNDKDQYIFSDLFHLDNDKKQKLLQISTKIKLDLGSVYIKSKSKIKARDMVEIKIETSLS